MSTASITSGVTRLDLQVQVSELRGAKLVADYYAAEPALASFYAGSPWDAAAWARTAQAVRDHFGAPQLQAMLPAVQAGSVAAQHRLERIANGEGFFVQTGQQAGLFGGPLYTVHKILSTIKLARRLEAQLAVPVAPLFWIAADDHDFAEVNHAYVLDASNELQRVGLARDEGPPSSMARRRLGPDIEPALNQLRAHLPGTDFSDELHAFLARAYRPEASVAEAFSALIGFLFDRFDLLITSSAHPVVKRLAVPLLRHELRNAEAHEDAVNAQTQKLVSLGYHEQVPVRSDAANVSYEDENGRDRLMRFGADWELSRSKQRVSGVEIADLIEREPQRFSANALLRPVIASAIFPTLGYVAGPAEISYYAQIGCLFAAHAVPMPLVVPRAGAEIVEYKVQKVLDKFGLTAADVRVPFDRLATRIIREEVPAAITETIERLRQRLTEGYGALVDSAVEIDPTLRGPIEKARNAGHKTLDDIDKKIVRHMKKRRAIELEQLRRAANGLYPLGQPQERVIGIASFYARYGPDVVDAIADQIDYALDRPAAQWAGVTCG